MMKSRVQLVKRLEEISVDTVEVEEEGGKWKHIPMDRIRVVRQDKGMEIYI